MPPQAAPRQLSTLASRRWRATRQPPQSCRLPQLSRAGTKPACRPDQGPGGQGQGVMQRDAFQLRFSWEGGRDAAGRARAPSQRRQQRHAYAAANLATHAAVLKLEPKGALQQCSVLTHTLVSSSGSLGCPPAAACCCCGCCCGCSRCSCCCCAGWAAASICAPGSVSCLSVCVGGGGP